MLTYDSTRGRPESQANFYTSNSKDRSNQLGKAPLPRFASTTMDFYKDPIPSEKKTAISVGFKNVA